MALVINNIVFEMAMQATLETYNLKIIVSNNIHFKMITLHKTIKAMYSYWKVFF